MVRIFLGMTCATFLWALLFSCTQKMEKAEEAPIGNYTVNFEEYSKQTLETTLRYRQIYLSKAGSKEKKMIVGFGSLELDYFPTDPTILKNTNYEIIEAVARAAEKSPPLDGVFTLYMDPDVFSNEEYQAVVEFIKSNYSQPIENNKLVKWLDACVVGLDNGNVFYSIYAVVYQKLAYFEPEFHAVEGKDYLRIRVNNKLYISRVGKDGLETAGDYDYILRHDTLFYPSYEERATMEKLLTFKSKEGELFAKRVKVLQAVTPN